MFKLAYCDKIADTIHKALLKHDPDGIIGLVDRVKWDLHPTEGWMQSTAKSITVYDMNGKAYIVSVQEAPMLDKDI